MADHRTDVLVLGAGGRLGQALVRLLPSQGLSVRGVPRGSTGVDVCDHDGLAACIGTARPRVVVYAAGIAEPDRCEQDPAMSHAVNVIGADLAASSAAAVPGCRVVYYSSDYVFGGPGSYFEDAPVAPLQVYGRHKAEAEQLVLGRGDNVVIRLPLLFGSRDFVAEAVEATARGTLLARDGRVRYPISVRHVVQVTELLLVTAARAGIYHAVGVDPVTKAEWAAYIAGLLGKPVPPAAVSSSQPTARRPLDVELATRHPELRTHQGALWEETRARVAELRG